MESVIFQYTFWYIPAQSMNLLPNGISHFCEIDLE